MSKGTLRFDLNGTVFLYEGINTPEMRQKDLLDLLVKRKADQATVLLAFRDNLDSAVTAHFTDNDILLLHQEAVEYRKNKKAIKKAMQSSHSMPNTSNVNFAASMSPYIVDADSHMESVSMSRENNSTSEKILRDYHSSDNINSNCDNAMISLSVPPIHVSSSAAESSSSAHRRAESNVVPAFICPRPDPSELPTKLTLTIQGQGFSYTGLPSQKLVALVDLLSKQTVGDAVALQAFHENITSNYILDSVTDAQLLVFVEERKRQRALKKQGVKQHHRALSASQVGTTTESGAVHSDNSNSPHVYPAVASSASLSSARVQHQEEGGSASARRGRGVEILPFSAINAVPPVTSLSPHAIYSRDDSMGDAFYHLGASRSAIHEHSYSQSADWEGFSAAERRDLNHFIREVLETPTEDFACSIRNGPPPVAVSEKKIASLTQQPQELEQPFNHSLRVLPVDKCMVYCQQEGSPTNKLVTVPKTITLEELKEIMIKKFGTSMSFSFNEGDDRIVIDDDDVLQLFFAQETAKLRLVLVPEQPSAESKATGPQYHSHQRSRSLSFEGKEDGGVDGDQENRESKQDSGVSSSAHLSTVPGAVTADIDPSKFPVKHNLVNTLPGQLQAIYCCAWDLLGQKFVTCSRDKDVKVYTVGSKGSKKMHGGHSGFVLSCDFSPKGDKVVSGSNDKTIKVWDVKSKGKSLSLSGHENKVYCVKYNSTGEYIISCSCDRTVRVWKAATGECLAKLYGHSLSVFSCDMSGTDAGNYIVSGGDDRLVKVWDWRAVKEIKSLSGHNATIWGVSYSHNDKYVVSCGMNHELIVWSLADEAMVLNLTDGMKASVHHAIFSNDDRYVLACAKDGIISIWDVQNGHLADTICGNSGAIFHMDLNPRNELLTVGLDVPVKIWKMNFPAQ